MTPTAIDLLSPVPVVPVLTIRSLDDLGPLAEALLAGGLSVLEITLRTEVALDAIERLATGFPEAVVGAGTVVEPSQVAAARDAGARFLVSPGQTDELLDAFANSRLPCLPGVATASEAMKVAGAGFPVLKLFPAETIGGVALLRSLAGPLPDLRFCPTGGIDADRAAAYLDLPNVLCVGGSWMARPEAVSAGRWDEISSLAQAAAALR